VEAGAPLGVVFGGWLLAPTCRGLCPAAAILAGVVAFLPLPIAVELVPAPAVGGGPAAIPAAMILAPARSR
jgi:hypothetical protein